MIFVTVGTHEQGFDRLIKKIDAMKAQGEIQEEVVMQIGYTSYQPKHCIFEPFFSSNEMNDYMKKADVVITHGGASSYLQALSYGKKVLVVPRLKEFDEHINNHQLEFLQKIQKIFPLEYIVNIEDLSEKWKEKSFSKEMPSNNQAFNLRLKQIVKDLIES